MKAQREITHTRTGRYDGTLDKLDIKCTVTTTKTIFGSGGCDWLKSDYEALCCGQSRAGLKQRVFFNF